VMHRVFCTYDFERLGWLMIPERLDTDTQRAHYMREYKKDP
jgi:hypothetical protein